jgi:kelch-like protein 20
MGTSIPLAVDYVNTSMVQGGWSNITLGPGRTYTFAKNDVLLFLAAGTYTSTSLSSSALNWYDIRTNQWTSSQLGEERTSVNVVFSSPYVIFAGGPKNANLGSVSVDIFDISGSTLIGLQALSTAYLRISTLTNRNNIVLIGDDGVRVRSDSYEICTQASSCNDNVFCTLGRLISSQVN